MEVRKWEYQIIEGTNRLSEKTLNGFGYEGWELVHVEVTFNSAGNDQRRTYYFKRPKESA